MQATGAQDLSVGGLVNRTVNLLAAHPRALLLPLVLLGALSGLLDPSPWMISDPWEFDFDRPSFSPRSTFIFAPAVFALLGLAGLVLFVAWFGVVLGTTRAAFMALRGEGDPAFRLAFAAVRPVLPGGIVTGLLAFGVFVVGLVLLVVPGFIALALFVPLSAVVVAEGRFFVDALKRSAALTEGRRLGLFVVVVLGAIASSLLAGPFAFIPVVGGLVAGALQGVVEAAFAVLAAVYYAAATAPAPPEAPIGLSPFAPSPGEPAPGVPGGPATPLPPPDPASEPRTTAMPAATTAPRDRDDTRP